MLKHWNVVAIVIAEISAVLSMFGEIRVCSRQQYVFVHPSLILCILCYIFVSLVVNVVVRDCSGAAFGRFVTGHCYH